MKKFPLIAALLFNLSALGCCATPKKVVPKTPAPVAQRPPRTIDTVLPVQKIPQGYLITDESGKIWLITVSNDGRLLAYKVTQ